MKFGSDRLVDFGWTVEECNYVYELLYGLPFSNIPLQDFKEFPHTIVIDVYKDIVCSAFIDSILEYFIAHGDVEVVRFALSRMDPDVMYGDELIAIAARHNRLGILMECIRKGFYFYVFTNEEEEKHIKWVKENCNESIIDYLETCNWGMPPAREYDKFRETLLAARKATKEGLDPFYGIMLDLEMDVETAVMEFPLMREIRSKAGSGYNIEYSSVIMSLVMERKISDGFIKIRRTCSVLELDSHGMERFVRSFMEQADKLNAIE